MTRMRVTFWTLVTVAIGATGLVSRALSWPSGATTALTVAIAGAVTALTAGIALRMAVVVTRHHHPE